MRRLQLLVLLILSIVACSAAVARADNGQQTTLLLDPSGQPVGGVWQQWMNQSYMPTYNGPMVLDFAANASDCGYGGIGAVRACTANSALTPEAQQAQMLPETVINITSLISESHKALLRDSEWLLLYEQAHVVDDRDLTDAEREQFAAMWDRPVPANTPVGQWWMQGAQTNALGALNEWFAADYMICAVWPKLTWAILDYNGWEIGWDGMDPVSLTPLNPFPVLTDARDEGGLVVNGKYKGTITYPPTRHEEQVFLTQRRSCSIIRSWIQGQ